MQQVKADPVLPVDSSIRIMILPEIAMKIALGGKVSDTPDGVQVAYESDALVMHRDDHETALRVARRLRPHIPQRLTPGVLISLMSIAGKFVTEELFQPGRVRVIYYPARSTPAGSFYRCILPALAIRERSTKVSAHVAQIGSAREALDYDVIVIQMTHTPQTIQFAKKLKELGKKIVFEVDDVYDRVEAWHDYQQRDFDLDLFYQMLGIADVVTVTTKYLASHYREHTREEIVVLPNYVLKHEFPRASADPHEGFRVLWAGSPSHFGDLAVVGRALSAFAIAHPDVKLVFFGRKPVEFHASDKQIEFHDWTDFKEYPNKLAALAGDVAIAPLADVPFNYGKSNLKLLEYGACGYPIIASNVGPYKETGQGRVVLCDKESDWTDALEAMYARPDVRKEWKRLSGELAEEYDAMTRMPDLESFFLDLAGRK